MGTLEELFWEFVTEFFDFVGLVAVGDEESVLSLNNDEVIDSEEGDARFLASVKDDVVLRIYLGDFIVRLVAVSLRGEIFRDRDP